ncbi:MAG: hypothetical protein AAGA66_11310, partial [Bacteroidota bacterium]
MKEVLDQIIYDLQYVKVASFNGYIVFHDAYRDLMVECCRSNDMLVFLMCFEVTVAHAGIQVICISCRWNFLCKKDEGCR